MELRVFKRVPSKSKIHAEYNLSPVPFSSPLSYHFSGVLQAFSPCGRSPARTAVLRGENGAVRSGGSVSGLPRGHGPARPAVREPAFFFFRRRFFIANLLQAISDRLRRGSRAGWPCPPPPAAGYKKSAIYRSSSIYNAARTHRETLKGPLWKKGKGVIIVPAMCR